MPIDGQPSSITPIDSTGLTTTRLQPTRTTAGWQFLSFAGQTMEVAVEIGEIVIGESWSILGEDDAGWRPGGGRPTAFHAGHDLLVVLMHQGGVLTISVLALARQVGVLNQRAAPAGALTPTTGPKIGVCGGCGYSKLSLCRLAGAWPSLHCSGCHRPDGTGSAPDVPSLRRTMGSLVATPEGREYIARVPEVA